MDLETKQVLRRIYKCANKKCGDNCQYCAYRENAAQMLLEFLLMDMHTYHKNHGKMMGSWDVKDILVQTYHKLREMETEISEDKDDE